MRGTLALVILLLALPAAAQPTGGSGKCLTRTPQELQRLRFGKRAKSFTGLALVTRKGNYATYTQPDEPLTFAGVELEYKYYIFVDGVLTYIQMRSKSYPFDGPAAKGYATAADHLRIVAHLGATHGGCGATMTKEIHTQLSDSCEQRYGVPHCNAPIVWLNKPIFVMSIFALESESATIEGPHRGYTVIEFTKAM